MPGIDLGAVKISITAENAQAMKSVDSTGKAIDSMSKKSSKSLDSLSKTFLKVGTNMTKYVSAPIAAAAVAAVKMASDMQETINKVDVVFGDNADQVKAWGDTTIDSIGMAKQTALDMAAGFQDMGTSMGVNIDKSSKMSMQLVQLAGDMASFKNISVERAQQALTAVYTGETESLKSLGIVMTQANLQQFAINQGIETNLVDMSQAELVQLRYAYVLSQTTNAQGDFQRTSDSAANQSRTFKERIKELGAQFGDKLLPIVENVLEQVNGLLNSFSNMDSSTQNAVLWGLGIAAAIGPVTKAIGDVLGGIGKVKDAFAAGTLNLSTIGWVTGALVAVAAIGEIVLSVKGYYDRIYQDSNNLKTAMSGFSGEMITIEKNFQTDMQTIETTSELAGEYIDELERLEGTGLKTNEQQQKYASIIRTLKTLIPGLNLEIDKQTGLIVGGANAVRSQTQAWKEQAVQQSMLTKQTQQVDALANAIQALTDAEVAAASNEKELSSIRDRQIEIEKQLATATGKTTDELNKMPLEIHKFLLRQAGEEAVNLNDEYGNLETKANELTIGQTALNESISTAKDTVAAATAEVDKTTAAYEKAYGIMAETDEATAGTDAVTDALDEVGTSADNAAKDVKDFSSDVSDMTSNLLKEADITMKEATKNLQANTQLYDSLWTNIGSLMKRGVSQDFLYYLQQMGPEGWKIIDEMNKSSDKKLKEFVDAWTTNGEAAKQTWETEIGKIPDATKDAMDDATDEARTGGKNVGTALGQGVENGVSDTTASIAAQAKRTVQAAIKAAKSAAEIASPSKKMKSEVGKPLAQGITVGFDDELDNTIKTIKKGIGNLVLGGVSATQKNVLSGYSSTLFRPVSVIQHNSFSTPTQSPYQIMLEQQKLSKNLLKGVS